MAARKRPKKKAVEVVQAVPLKHRFPEDDDPSPYHDGRDPDAADEDSDDEEEPTWTEYKETFYEGQSLPVKSRQCLCIKGSTGELMLTRASPPRR